MQLAEFANRCDEYLQGRLLFIPNKLRDRLRQLEWKTRPEKIDTIALVWVVIRNRSFETSDTTWRSIHSSYFGRIAGSNATIYWAKQWLEGQGFIEWSRGYVSKNVATNFNPGRSQGYRICSSDETAMFKLHSKTSMQALFRNEPSREVPRDHEAIYARRQLDLLTPDGDSAKTIFMFVLLCLICGIDYRANDADDSLERILRNQTDGSLLNTDWNNDFIQLFGLPMLKIISKTGSVRRGTQVNRLYTPFSTLLREFRHAFSFAGDNWVNIDMTCSQPTILAYKCSDSRFKHDCLSDRLYTKIGESLDLGRDAAKRLYCKYAYGRNRSPNKDKQSAFALQEFMQREYPQAAEYVWRKKENNHCHFIQEMQNAEAAIFVDTIHARLRVKKIPALTIHDSIFTTEKHSGVVRAVVEGALSEQGIEQKVKEERKETEKVSKPYMLGTFFKPKPEEEKS